MDSQHCSPSPAPSGSMTTKDLSGAMLKFGALSPAAKMRVLLNDDISLPVKQAFLTKLSSVEKRAFRQLAQLLLKRLGIGANKAYRGGMRNLAGFMRMGGPDGKSLSRSALVRGQGGNKAIGQSLKELGQTFQPKAPATIS